MIKKLKAEKVTAFVKRTTLLMRVSKGVLRGIVTFLVIVAFINSMWLLSSWYKVPDLFSKYFEVENDLTVHPSTEYGSLFERAITAYQAEKYNDAINLGRTILEQYPRSDTLKYFLGASHLALGQAKPAVYYLREVANDSNSPLRLRAKWNLGLAYVLEGDRTSAITTLEKSNHPRAQELINSLSEH
ncbi:MAG: tetratricopeptide repeat protein [Lunatimonas sp.]|uniref:tetratricopeptide repeat protein n=1 Tax=Lunatimonas sp. TaxID=2060141 RepID=UPI002A3DEABC|nr:tetratricopeptide repeat protein [Lunatimonas sp.]